jgi:hypothetical protein
MRIHFPAMRVKQKRESNSQVCKRSRGKVRLERGLLSLCLIVYQSKGQTGLFIRLPFIGQKRQYAEHDDLWPYPFSFLCRKRIPAGTWVLIDSVSRLLNMGVEISADIGPATVWTPPVKTESELSMT